MSTDYPVPGLANCAVCNGPPLVVHSIVVVSYNQFRQKIVAWPSPSVGCLSDSSNSACRRRPPTHSIPLVLMNGCSRYKRVLLCDFLLALTSRRDLVSTFASVHCNCPKSWLNFSLCAARTIIAICLHQHFCTRALQYVLHHFGLVWLLSSTLELSDSNYEGRNRTLK